MHSGPKYHITLLLFRVYGKKILKYVPIVGWSWNMSDVVFLERNWEKDKLNLSSKLNSLMDYPSPVWILLFPEGTRYTNKRSIVRLCLIIEESYFLRIKEDKILSHAALIFHFLDLLIKGGVHKRDNCPKI